MRNILVGLLFVFYTVVGVAAEEYNPQQYIEIFSNPNIIQKQQAIQTLEWAGLSDPRIFDLLEKDLLENYKTAESGALIRALNWVARGLSFSGNEKYIPTLEAVAEDGAHRNLRKFGKQGLEDLQKYKAWNALINPNHANIKAGYPSQQERFKNMLRSDNYELIRIAAKRIHRDHLYEHAMLDIAAATIEKYYQKVDDDLSIDAIAWVLRATAGSADPKYKPLIEKVAAEAENKKLRKNANKYLDYYG